MADYAAYGLDTEKLSSDPGKRTKNWICLWCDGQVRTGFYLCFQNWCICPQCVMDLRDRARAGHPLTPDTECFKCREKSKPGHRISEHLALDLFICPDCLEWAHDSLFFTEKPEPA